jgi:hypothetical protein
VFTRLLSGHHSCDIFCHRFNGLDIELLLERFGHVGRQKSRQRGHHPDAPHPPGKGWGFSSSPYPRGVHSEEVYGQHPRWKQDDSADQYLKRASSHAQGLTSDSLASRENRESPHDGNEIFDFVKAEGKRWSSSGGQSQSSIEDRRHLFLSQSHRPKVPFFCRTSSGMSSRQLDNGTCLVEEELLAEFLSQQAGSRQVSTVAQAQPLHVEFP